MRQGLGCRLAGQVGTGKWTPGDFREALDAADRTRCGLVTPPEGLYLAFVRYPGE